MSEIAERAYREFDIGVEIKEQADRAGRAALSAERRARLGLSDEHYRKHHEWMRTMQALGREQLQEGISYFSTFSLEILQTFLTDLKGDGPFARAHGLEGRLGVPSFSIAPYSHGLQKFLATYQHRYADERYIRDYLNFQPSDPKIILLTWDALGLKAPTGLTELSGRSYSRQRIRRLLIVGLALHRTQYEHAVRNLTTTGYAQGDEIADRTEHLRWMSPGFAKYMLDQDPEDQMLAKKLTGPQKDLFSLTLEGVSQNRFLHFLGIGASTANP
jgi:hypothetical protein